MKKFGYKLASNNFLHAIGAYHLPVFYIMSPTDLQCWADQALLDGGVDSIMKKYLTNEGWNDNDIKMLAFAIKFWRQATRSRSTKEREANTQYFLAALFVHKGLDTVMPIRLSMCEEGDTGGFLKNKKLVKSMGKSLFESTEFERFRYQTKKHDIQLGDVSSLDYGVKHICPKSIVIKFEGKISYLIERTSPKTKMFFRDPSADKSRTRKIKELKIEWKKAGKVSIWDKVSIKSVAMGVRYDEPTDVYTVSDRTVYVELELGGKEVEKALRLAGGEEGNLKMTSKSNLKQYVPKERWEVFDEDIETAKKDFASKNTKLLNEATGEKKQKSRNALEQLKLHFGNSKNLAEVDYEEPEEAENRAANSNRAISVTSGEDTNMSDVNQSSDGEL